MPQFPFFVYSVMSNTLSLSIRIQTRVFSAGPLTNKFLLSYAIQALYVQSWKENWNPPVCSTTLQRAWTRTNFSSSTKLCFRETCVGFLCSFMLHIFPFMNLPPRCGILQNWFAICAYTCAREYSASKTKVLMEMFKTCCIYLDTSNWTCGASLKNLSKAS